MKTKLALLSAVILAGIGSTVAIAGHDTAPPVRDKTANMSHCDMGKMNHDQAGGMSCHSGGQAAAPSKGGCCK